MVVDKSCKRFAKKAHDCHLNVINERFEVLRAD